MLYFDGENLSESGIIGFNYHLSSGGEGLATIPVASAVPACPGDADLSGAVDFDDLNLILASWGKAYGQVGFILEADLDADNVISFDDLNLVLTDWGCAE